jgi:transposase
VGNVLNEKELLPGQSTLDLCQLNKAIATGAFTLRLRRSRLRVPDCGVQSRARRSSYLRHLKDLPIQGRAVRLTVRVGRWRCRNTVCKRRIFCQRLSNEVAPNMREKPSVSAMLCNGLPMLWVADPASGWANVWDCQFIRIRCWSA